MIDTSKEYKVVGMMSGTSLDGMDLAYCTFLHKSNTWHYLISQAETFPYPSEWKEKLSILHLDTDENIQKTNQEYGEYIGEIITAFIEKHSLKPDLIASHGHTVFHDPFHGITLQIGDGKAIAARTGITVINDFRSEDLALCGQGAPLVPMGDKLLFQEYTYCLNLGGFANISFDRGEQRIGFDIGPCNLLLNFLSRKLGKEFDESGELASQGKVIDRLFNQLNDLSYYDKAPPKSLGKEWLDDHVFPIIDKADEDPHDLLRTCTEHIAFQVARVCKEENNIKVLVTGGGAYNGFLIKRMHQLSGQELIVPDDLTVQFKEALVFAFLGVLKIRNEINILSSVTGSSKDHSPGTINRPEK